MSKLHALMATKTPHREYLMRCWNPKLPTLLFVMLNPSEADDFVDDPTSRKCRGFAERLGFGGIVIVNLFTFRATNPIELRKAGYPNVAHADAIIRREAGNHSVAVCGWGRNAAGHPRVAQVVELLESQNCAPMALRLSADGTPWHPLYLPYSCTLTPLP